MHVEQLFVETLIDIRNKLSNNPSEYQLLRVSGLLRHILIDKKPLIKPAIALGGLVPLFRVVKPPPRVIPPEQDEAWAKMHATQPDVKRVDFAFDYRGHLLAGVAQNEGDQELSLELKDFLKHEIITWMDTEYTVENVLRLVAHSLGGVHLGNTNDDPAAQELCTYMEGAMMFGRSLPAVITFDMARCTLRACEPLATGWPN
jgi:hypothetical protein